MLEDTNNEMNMENNQNQIDFLNLDSIDFTNFQHKITSPRSLKACKKIGIETKDLYYIDLDGFRNSSFELKNLDPEFLRMRYNHAEMVRKRLIDEARAERHRIIEEEKNKKMNQSQTNPDLNKTSTSQDKMFSTAIEIEKKQIEKIKYKQKKEIESMIEYEVKMELIRKNNEEKIRKQAIKVEHHMAEVKEHRKKEEMEKKRREFEKAERLRIEEETLKKQYKEKMEKEQKRIGEIVKLEQEKHRENIKKAEEQKQKQEKYREEMEKIQKKLLDIAIQKQKEMEIKDHKRKEALEVKRKRDIMNAERAKYEHEKKIALQRKNMDHKLERQKQEFNEKQRKNEEKRLQFERQQHELYMRKKKESQEREIEIRRILEANKDGEKMKLVNYYKKQEQIKEHKIEIEKEREIIKNQIIQKREKRNQDLIITKNRNDEMENNKKSKILTKIHHVDETINKQKQENERKNMLKHEQEVCKNYEKKIQLKRLEKMTEFEVEEKLNEMRSKQDRIDHIKAQKYMMLCKKREMSDAVSKQKREVKERFDIVMKKHKGINEEALKELFPGDDELVKKLMDMKKQIVLQTEEDLKVSKRNDDVYEKEREDETSYARN